MCPPQQVDAIASGQAFGGSQVAIGQGVRMRTRSWSINCLASPAFGERMATWWFDLVRFADTVGYHGDQDHRITPYRDYVIKSFNDNLPFDQFTIEQLAGDLLPNPTMWQLVATGYNRVLQTTHEGGAQDGEYRAIYAGRPRAEFFGNVAGRARWAAPSATTTSSTRTRQEDFYSLQAFFADVDQYGSFQPVGSNDIPTQRPPEMMAWTLPVYEKMQELDAKIAEAEKLARRADQGRLGEESRRADRSCKKERVDLEAQFVPTMITQGRAAARDSHSAARQLDGQIGQGRPAAHAALS